MAKVIGRNHVSKFEREYEDDDSSPPSSSVSIAELPEDLIRDHLCPLLKMKMIARLALCNKFFYKCVTEDSVWYGAWMKINMNAKQQLKTPLKRFHPAMITKSEKLYKIVCACRNICLVKKLEEQWKQHQQQISMRGPLYTLRRFVLREMQSRQFEVSNTRFSMLGRNALDYGKINQDCPSFSENSSISIPLKIVATAQKERFCEKWIGDTPNMVCSPVSIKGGGRAFCSSISLKLALKDDFGGICVDGSNLPKTEVKYPASFYSKRSVIKLQIKREVDEIMRSKTFAYSLMDEVSRASIIGTTNDKSLELTTHEIIPLQNVSTCDCKGSITTGKWHGDDNFSFAMANIPMLMLEREFLDRYRNDNALSFLSPSAFTLQITIRTFGRVLWEHLFRDMNDSMRQDKDHLKFELIQSSTSSDSDSDNEFLMPDAKLMVKSDTGIDCVIENAIVMDTCLFNCQGHAIWARSEAVNCKVDQDTSIWGHQDCSHVVAKIGESESVQVNVELCRRVEQDTDSMHMQTTVQSLTMNICRKSKILVR
uniref:F-box domain-containing protein n=1 Tax=Leptocylindrus danicus TaxID=163516 RepID=A0A7S2LK62_9STRA|mmetsp:Transcript_6684/g.9902  ORF Transcript_6684/g.9902 Transcript_6684/m.9902 type:complete len:539 (+) Transcript_6684:210-1826(+)